MNQKEHLINKSPKGTNICAKEMIGVKWGVEDVWRCANCRLMKKKFGAINGDNRENPKANIKDIRKADSLVSAII